MFTPYDSKSTSAHTNTIKRPSKFASRATTAKKKFKYEAAIQDLMNSTAQFKTFFPAGLKLKATEDEEGDLVNVGESNANIDSQA